MYDTLNPKYLYLIDDSVKSYFESGGNADEAKRELVKLMKEYEGTFLASVLSYAIGQVALHG